MLIVNYERDMEILLLRQINFYFVEYVKLTCFIELLLVLLIFSQTECLMVPILATEEMSTMLDSTILRYNQTHLGNSWSFTHKKHAQQYSEKSFTENNIKRCEELQFTRDYKKPTLLRSYQKILRNINVIYQMNHDLFWTIMYDNY